MYVFTVLLDVDIHYEIDCNEQMNEESCRECGQVWFKKKNT